ncbi:MAG: oligosaccharide flippase family protein [Bacteroidales bacterium]
MAEEKMTLQGEGEEEQKSQFKDLLKYTGLFGGMQGLNLLTSLVRNKFTALFLGPSGIGLISLFMSVVTILNNATNLGVGMSGVRDLSAIAGEEDTPRINAFIRVIRGWSLLTAGIGAALCFFAAPLLSSLTFDTDRYIPDFRLLSVVIFLTTLTAGELAVLKGLRMLRQVALSTVAATFLSLFPVIPIYYFFREAAIVPAMVLIASFSFITTLYYSNKALPFRIHTLSLKNLRAGIPMVRLGSSLVIAGLFGALVEYGIRTFILAGGTSDAVGLYNTGLVICTSYMGMIFIAIDNDFFSRLSGINRDTDRSNRLVNQQIELSMLLISPVIGGLLILLPVVVRLLYSADFLQALPMIRWAWLYMFFRGFNLPMAYIILSRGASRIYLSVELMNHLFTLVFCIGGYWYGGFMGLGAGMSLASVCEAGLLYLIVNRKYGFRFSGSLIRQTLLFLSMLLIPFLLSPDGEEGVYWVPALSGVFLISALSLYLIQKRTSLLNRRKSK